MYIKESIITKRLQELEDPGFKVLWFYIRPQDYQEALNASSPHIFTTHLVLTTLKSWSTCPMSSRVLKVCFLVAVLLSPATLTNWTQNIFVEISA